MPRKSFSDIRFGPYNEVAGIFTNQPEIIILGNRLRDPELRDLFLQNEVRNATAMLSHETLHGTLEKKQRRVFGQKGREASMRMDTTFQEKLRNTPYHGIAIQKAHKFIEERPE